MEIGGWDVGVALVKALTYAASLGAAGIALFSLYAAPPEPPLRNLRQPLIRLVIAGLLLTGVKFPLLAGALGGAARAIDLSLLRRVLLTGEGVAATWRAAGLVLLLAAARSRVGRTGLLLGAVLVAGSFAASGHVHARHVTLLGALLALHALCAAFWIGALWPLERLLARQAPLAPTMVARFSRLALGAVPVLLVAGSVLLVQLLGSVAALWGTAYGRWLCVKLTLVCGLLGLAALNRLRLTPRLATAEGRRALRLSIRAELALAAGVLAVTAALTTFTGPGD